MEIPNEDVRRCLEVGKYLIGLCPKLRDILEYDIIQDSSIKLSLRDTDGDLCTISPDPLLEHIPMDVKIDGIKHAIEVKGRNKACMSNGPYLVTFPNGESIYVRAKEFSDPSRPETSIFSTAEEVTAARIIGQLSLQGLLPM